MLQRNGTRRDFYDEVVGRGDGRNSNPSAHHKTPTDGSPPPLFLAHIRTYSTSSPPPDVPFVAWTTVLLEDRLSRMLLPCFYMFLSLDFCFSCGCSIHNCSVLIDYGTGTFPQYSEVRKRGLGPRRMRQASETPAFPRRVPGLGW